MLSRAGVSGIRAPGPLRRGLHRVRGTLTLVLVAVVFLLVDLVQRTVIAGLVRIRPARRDAILSGWIRFMARLTLHGLVSGVGGAKIPELPRLPDRGKVLILMNHQSLLDIPLAVLSLESRYPWFVTRRRYARGIPVVSHMLRLYGFPLVEPGQDSAEQTARLAAHAQGADRPMLIFPEGHRTRDGRIRPFRRGGASAILATGDWEVYAVVVDGFWRCGRIQEFTAEISSVRARTTCLGPFSHDPDRESSAAFLERMRRTMVEALEELRAGDEQ